MPKDKDLKRLVRARMAETGERYTTARAELAGAKQPATDWKETHIARADSMPVAVWRVFAAPEGEPLDIRQRFFTEPADEHEARTREEQLRTQVIAALDNWRRDEFMTDTPPRPSAVPGLEMHFHEHNHLRRTSWMGAGPEDAPRLPIPVLAARALTQITGEEHQPVSVTARYRASVTSVGTVDTALEVIDRSMPVAEIRRLLAGRLREYPMHARQARAIEAGVFADGKVSVIWRATPRGTVYGLPSDDEPTLPENELRAAALADLTD